MDASTIARVDAIWDQLGLGPRIDSPSRDGHIVAPMPYDA
jgi:hypothetical protein